MNHRLDSSRSPGPTGGSSRRACTVALSHVDVETGVPAPRGTEGKKGKGDSRVDVEIGVYRLLPAQSPRD